MKKSQYLGWSVIMQPAPALAAPAREVAALSRSRPALLQSWTLEGQCKNTKWTWSVNKVFHNFDTTWIVSDGVVATMLLSKPPLTSRALSKSLQSILRSVCFVLHKQLAPRVKLCRPGPGLHFSNWWPIMLATGTRGWYLMIYSIKRIMGVGFTFDLI